MKIIDNAISISLLEELIEFYDTQPISNVRYRDNGDIFRYMKHPLYDDHQLLPYQILNPILNSLIGEHAFDGGHYLDAIWPFTAHFDTNEIFKSRNILTHDCKNSSNLGILIPFSENKNFRTVFFDYFLEHESKKKLSIPDNPTENDPSLMEMLDHHSDEEFQILKYIPVSDVAEWRMGSIIVWPRHQLHCSSNFAKFNLTKQALVLWV